MPMTLAGGPWHSLRHVFCTTALFGWRLDVTDVAKLARHSNVNMAELSFIDARCTRMIIDAARSLPPARKFALWCSPAITSRFVLLGATGVPCISLVTGHDR
jgi:hypothetical protein